MYRSICKWETLLQSPLTSFASHFSRGSTSDQFSLFFHTFPFEILTYCKYGLNRSLITTPKPRFLPVFHSHLFSVTLFRSFSLYLHSYKWTCKIYMWVCLHAVFQLPVITVKYHRLQKSNLLLKKLKWVVGRVLKIDEIYFVSFYAACFFHLTIFPKLTSFIPQFEYLATPLLRNF